VKNSNQPPYNTKRIRKKPSLHKIRTIELSI
jgi:hypothetical protein